ncbi:DUF664 domain-containing protein [Gordonia sp. CPCC 205515]|uniref:mycothiol transferase n=1 Tax=Gordonia sp. CPCC 205515 TaxID=3140791 RepID=UPI003AF37F18
MNDDNWLDACLDTADRCWGGIVSILSDLDDEQANRRLDSSGANSPYAIGHHCVEMTRWWLGTFGCGRRLPRDRSGEFEATGSVLELLERVGEVRADTAHWSREMLTHGIADRDARGTAATVDLATVTPQWVLLHVIHDLAQHLGQLQISRDELLR